MIKASGKKPDGTPILILGITEENVKRLKQNMPIIADGNEVKVPVEIVLLYGDTEADIMEDLRAIGAQGI